METKFKVGDKVRCIDADATECLELNKIYTVTRVSPYYIDVDNDGGYYPSRFKLVEEQNEIKQMNNKPDAFWIYVNSPIVSEFIQKLLFKNGFHWNYSEHSNKRFVVRYCEAPYLLVSFDTPIWGKKTIHFNSSISQPQFPSYDAVKDLPKIMELLETPSMPLPVVNGYTMEYKKDDLTVRFGCAEISTYMLFDAKCLMISEAYKGNRKIAKITLDSGVVLTKNDIENILKYVEFVNKK